MTTDAHFINRLPEELTIKGKDKKSIIVSELYLHCRMVLMKIPLRITEVVYWQSYWRKIHLSHMKAIGSGVKLLIKGINIASVVCLGGT